MNKKQLCKWNNQILDYFEALEEIEVERFSDVHVRITRVQDRRQMDFWTTTNTACWQGFKPLKHFKIKDLDKYIEQKFIAYGTN